MVLHHEGEGFVEIGFGEKHLDGALRGNRHTRHGKVDPAGREQLRQRGQCLDFDELDLDTQVARKVVRHFDIEADQLLLSV